MLRLPILLTVVLFFLPSLTGRSYGQSTISLAEINPMAGDYRVYGEGQHFTMGGQVFSGMVNNGYRPHAVYLLAGKYSQLTVWVGNVDRKYMSSGNRYTVSADGKIVADGEVGPAPVQLTVDVSGVRSLDLSCSSFVGWGEPLLTKAMSGGAAVPTLTAPAKGADVGGRYVTLSWSPVPGATGYGVEIVCTKGPRPAIYSYNCGGETTYVFPVPDGGLGDYAWSVMAFGPHRVLGKFSNSSMFHAVGDVRL